MRSWPWPLRKLRWQLSLSYIIAVLVAIPTLFGVGLVAVFAAPASPPPSPIAVLEQTLAGNIAPQLQQAVQDPKQRDWLRQWTISFLNDQQATKPGASGQFPRLNAHGMAAVLILDRHGQLIASNPAIPAGSGQDGQLDFLLRKLQLDQGEAHNLIRGAFANDTQVEHLAATFLDGRTAAAVPILDAQQSPAGVLFVVVSGLKSSPASTTNAFQRFLAQFNGQGSPGMILLYLFLLVLILSIICIAFGALTARRLTRRLQHITSAAHDWSMGQFEASIHDSVGDELGQLSHDLNHMARQISVLLNTRRELDLLEERQRVARELHDSVKQHTFAISLLIGAAQAQLSTNPDRAQNHLSKAGELADTTRQELSSILQQLRPPALATQNLPEALQSYTRQWSLTTSIASECHVQGAGQHLPLDLEEALLRVTQEALANIARHSQASQATVHLHIEPDRVDLQVEDNGKGLPARGEQPPGQGLRNMRERIEAWQGTLGITSDSNGTHIQACIPLDRSKDRILGADQEVTYE